MTSRREGLIIRPNLTPDRKRDDRFRSPIHAIATRASLSGLRMTKQLAMRPSTTSSVST